MESPKAMPAPKKYPLRTDRIRRPPKEGWSWIDRRFIRDKIFLLDRDTILLYFFLAAVADKHGLSYWSDASISELLKLKEISLARAREELEFQDLIAYQRPIYQVLSFAPPSTHRLNAEPSLLGDVFRELAKRVSTSDRTASPKGDSP